MATINKQISLGTDDCGERNDSTIYLTVDPMHFGYDENVEDVGLRWQSINIAQGASITSAKLSVYLTDEYGTLSANIRGIDEDNTATWSSGSRPSQRSKVGTITANEANWTDFVAGNWAYIYITSIIQSIINRGGWSANNALAITIEDTAGSGTHRASMHAYEYAGNLHGAKLDIVYETGRTTKNARSSMTVHSGVMFQTLTGGHGY